MCGGENRAHDSFGRPAQTREKSSHHRSAKIDSSPESAMEPARTGLRNIMRDLLRARPAEEAVVLAWPLICGQEVASRTRAVSFSEGKLTVEVPDAAWRDQLFAFAARYITGYQDLFGPLVQSVIFLPQRPGT